MSIEKLVTKKRSRDVPTEKFVDCAEIAASFVLSALDNKDERFALFQQKLRAFYTDPKFGRERFMFLLRKHDLDKKKAFVEYFTLKFVNSSTILEWFRLVDNNLYKKISQGNYDGSIINGELPQKT